MIWTPNTKMARVRQEGERVLIIVDGRAILDMPHDAALALSKAIHAQAKKAEEIAKANAIIADQALLYRADFPLGLSLHPDIKSEARKEAAWNSDLRRYIPKTPDHRPARFGVPTVSHAPAEGNHDDE